MLINEKLVKDYKKKGVTVIRKVISNFWLEKLSKGIEKNFKNPSKYKCVYEKKNNKEVFYDDYCNWNRIEEYKDFIFNSNIAKIAAQLMKSKKVNLFHEHILIKEPGATKRTPWHQDQPYYCVDGIDNCSLWIPLDKITKEVCPEYVKFSHMWKKQYLPTKFFGNVYEKKDKNLEAVPDISARRQDYDIESWELNPGDLIAFNFSIVHGAPGNNSPNRRRAFSVRFVGDDATFANRKGEMSPPFPEVKLKHGDKMNSPSFPEIMV
jgi:ectoine hydroxylase-related dioxygenase (phytanoyl-CoA dioxygenase family)